MKIAADFDGCLFETAWPEIIAPNWPVINELKARKTAGARIILWTCREDEPLQEAIAACDGVGITFDAVNDNLPELTEAFGRNSRKIFADEYWDDRAVLKVVITRPAGTGPTTINEQD